LAAAFTVLRGFSAAFSALTMPHLRIVGPAP
jgi:hypothetical protein